MNTVACLLVAFALGVGLGGIILAAGIAVYVLRAGMPGGLPAERDGSRSAGARCVDLRTEINGDEITNWRGTR